MVDLDSGGVTKVSVFRRRLRTFYVKRCFVRVKLEYNLHLSNKGVVEALQRPSQKLPDLAAVQNQPVKC